MIGKGKHVKSRYTYTKICCFISSKQPKKYTKGMFYLLGIIEYNKKFDLWKWIIAGSLFSILENFVNA